MEFNIIGVTDDTMETLLDFVDHDGDGHHDKDHHEPVRPTGRPSWMRASSARAKQAKEAREKVKLSDLPEAARKCVTMEEFLAD